jgi:hypothetical protein
VGEAECLHQHLLSGLADHADQDLVDRVARGEGDLHRAGGGEQARLSGRGLARGGRLHAGRRHQGEWNQRRTQQPAHPRGHGRSA